MLFAGGVSLFYAFHTCEFMWVSRSGSVITVLGVMLTIKHSIFSESRDLESVIKEKNHYAVFAPEKDSDIYNKHKERARHVIRDEYIGASFTIFGTVIWGYGDLLAKLFT